MYKETAAIVNETPQFVRAQDLLLKTAKDVQFYSRPTL